MDAEVCESGCDTLIGTSAGYRRGRVRQDADYSVTGYTGGLKPKVCPVVNNSGMGVRMSSVKPRPEDADYSVTGYTVGLKPEVCPVVNNSGMGVRQDAGNNAEHLS